VQASVVNQFLNQDQANSGEFPTVISVSGESPEIRLELEVNEVLIGFRGHFPGNPVLAGIVQVHWAATFASNFFNYNHVPTEIKRLKFKNVVQPPATLELSLRQVAPDSVQFEFVSKEYSHSMGLLVFDPVTK
jgi:3-hydroxymyristoyl/3-hydroxydecanoyl-(acyl carrier protein) dehydratase